jgi:putative pyruvate formate lyase activating enzyme
MIPFLTTVASMRPDAIAVWRDPEVARSLAWYRKVMTGNVPAKFILCRKIPAEVELNKADENELLSQHRRLSPILSNLVTNIQKGSGDAWIQKDEHPNLLDLKSALVNKTLEHCNFCEWRCNVNRTRGKIGFCRLDNTTSVGSHFHHYGEEAPLIGVEGRGGSGTIFFESCNAHCVFCQNWDISQPKTKSGIMGEIVTPRRLAEIADDLAREGAANINYVGGEPTVDLHSIIDSLRYMTRSVPLIWNSNMYCTMEAMEILADVIDLWLPDFKFWNDDCARRLMWVGSKASYREVVKRNHVLAAEHGSMITRHLVMPSHVECCTKPILKFVADTMRDRVLVNLMAQYYPANMVKSNPQKYPDIARHASRNEIQDAYTYARALGLQFEQVS